ncbi:protein CURVATURE THYLAKOID 1B, chloroplastic [Neltuma alba]|uniref:protein CURVATURE THYLAKOID 1B, chloroplastic n=1 Tax=Neltuma alba TaxID=207710 RepID=UPI0010A58316|nr:protein CURVATURE THYLAKOID 1B, chloroplastic-like [Prosopis alba]XP_028795801.1 protein CURVATURE THYLAKOID 1B, chloroplastic-like [Prosopis alba]
MASTSSSSLTLSSSSNTIVDRRAPRNSSAPSSPQCVSIPPLAPPASLPSLIPPWKATAYCRKLARNVMAMATGEASTEVAITTEPPEFLKTVQETWEKIEDKYAVSTVAVAGVVALWGSTGVISAIDRLPLIPGVLEVVGIGYTGWFAYKNLIYKPDREALLQKIKDTYNEIIGSSG